MKERKARLAGGIAVLRIGGASEVEVNEKKDRVEVTKKIKKYIIFKVFYNFLIIISGCPLRYPSCC